jgi:hypothetical protein
VTCRVTWRIEVEGEKTAIRDDWFLFIEMGTGWSTFCSAQCAGAGLFDILVLLSGEGLVDSAGHAAKLV